MKRIAVVGAGMMARIRARAFLATERAQICAVASRHRRTARKLGSEVGCKLCFDDFRKLAEASPDAVLVEVPHEAQEEIVLWALGLKLPVLIGGCLASSSASAEKIIRRAREKKVVVEAGYSERYNRTWEVARKLVQEGRLGRIAAVRTIALWDGDPRSWYYSQKPSGGMPLTHMTYCFINAVRWVLGPPRLVSAFANRVRETAPGMVAEESCVANFVFGENILCNMAASYIKPAAMNAWSATFLGTEGAMEVFPEERQLVIYRLAKVSRRDFRSAPDPFERQARVFLKALDGPNECRNKPEDSIADVRIAEAIVKSAREKRTVSL